tara:strand:+ start:3796 stop:3912 length:117 start_codon:yes stop_codon:yes gene_type:complete
MQDFNANDSSSTQKKNTNNLKKNPNKDIGEYIDYEEID